jgi:hypothetical protein
MSGPMDIAEKLKSAWDKWGPKGVSKCLRVEWDDTAVRVRVLDRMREEWNQDFLWSDITKVCFKDEGVSKSDAILLQLREPGKWATVLTEAEGGPGFVSELVSRGLFPKHMLDKAVGSSTGGMHCWPPNES